MKNGQKTMEDLENLVNNLISSLLPDKPQSTEEKKEESTPKGELDRLIDEFNAGVAASKVLAKKYSKSCIYVGGINHICYLYNSLCTICKVHSPKKNDDYKTSNGLTVKISDGYIKIDRFKFGISYLKVILCSILDGRTYEFNYGNNVYNTTYEGIICSSAPGVVLLPWEDVKILNDKLIKGEIC